MQARANEYVLPSEPLIYLGDLEDLRVETTDLSEIAVARINVGDHATVTFDALPGVQVSGRVARITPKSAEGSGVNYTVIVELDEIPAELRWGMTAFIDIVVD